jgi:hypothetical protein
VVKLGTRQNHLANTNNNSNRNNYNYNNNSSINNGICDSIINGSNASANIKTRIIVNEMSAATASSYTNNDYTLNGGSLKLEKFLNRTDPLALQFPSGNSKSLEKSNLRSDECTVYRDLCLDGWLFTGDALISRQYQMYRDMQKITGDRWEEYHPQTNTLWISYILEELLQMHGRVLKKENSVKFDQLKEKAELIRSSSDCRSALRRIK